MQWSEAIKILEKFLIAFILLRWKFHLRLMSSLAVHWHQKTNLKLMLSLNSKTTQMMNGTENKSKDLPSSYGLSNN